MARVGFWRWVALLCLLALPARADVLVFAAASLKEAMDAVAADWGRAQGGKAAVSYAASSALARQIEQGAPAQIFFSADLDWMDYLAAKKLIQPASRVALLGNRLVLIAPRGAAPVGIAPGFPLAALLGDRRLAMADTAAVPAGKYGKAALEKLDVWAAVAPKVAQAENVRAALLLVARGEAPFGIVYQTDAAADPAVTTVGVFPADSHPPIVYPVALTRSADAEGAALLAFLRGDAARRRFEERGFTVLGQ
jgi:molybdate transport system substrate-binding protein